MNFEKFMKWLRERAIDEGIAAIHESTGKFLSFLTYVLARERNFLNIVELGAGIGYSTLWMLYGVLKADGKCKIHAVERKEKIYEKGKEILKEVKKILGEKTIDFLNFYLKDADDLKSGEFGEIDILFLDIHKKGYYPNLLKFEKNIKNGGVIIAHNVFSHEEELRDFIKEIRKEEKYTTFFLETDPQGISISFKK